MKYDFTPLKGRSNANIFFDYQNKLVKKSVQIENFIRLQNQAEKQNEFLNFNIKNVKTPKVIKVFKNSFEMEFINGKNFIQFAEDSNSQFINLHIENILNYLQNIKEKRKKSEISFNKSLERKLISLNTQKKHREIFFYITNLIEKNKLNLDSTYCHGDLSLSNIIFKDKEIFLIDFLDPFFNSYYFDIAKIRQDVFYNWLFRVNDYSSIKSEIVSKKINESISTEFKKEISSMEFKIIELMNFLRIEPYTKKKSEKQFLSEIIYKIFNKISR